MARGPLPRADSSIVSGGCVESTQSLIGPKTASCPVPEACDIPPASVVNCQWTKADLRRQSGRRSILRGAMIVPIRTSLAVLAASMIGDRGIHPVMSYRRRISRDLLPTAGERQRGLVH